MKSRTLGLVSSRPRLPPHTRLGSGRTPSPTSICSEASEPSSGGGVLSRTWFQKADSSSMSQEAGEAAYWGTQLEPFVRSEFTKRTGIEVKQVKELLVQ